MPIQFSRLFSLLRAALLAGVLGALIAALWVVWRQALPPEPAPAPVPVPTPLPPPALRGEPPLFAPYLDVSEALSTGLPMAQSRVSLAWDSRPGAPADWASLPAVTLAFATGTCGQERWGWRGHKGDRVVRHLMAPLQRLGVGVIVSTGGAGARFACNDAGGMDAFVRRYADAGAIGFDFDIEWRQSRADIDALVQQVATAAQRHPGLRWSFTLAVSAAAEGDPFNATGVAVLDALARTGFETAIVNLMVMNYGPAKGHGCVPDASGRTCDMVASAQRVVQRVRARPGWGRRPIALTPMLGINEMSGNQVSTAQARALAQLAWDAGAVGLHYWSINRDRPCKGAVPDQQLRNARDNCHGLGDTPALAYARAMGQAIAVTARDDSAPGATAPGYRVAPATAVKPGRAAPAATGAASSPSRTVG